MDFKRLGYFAQVAEHGSLSKTASTIGIAQPSLSRQMRLLEEELGVELFKREPRGMTLTEAGDLLYSRVAGPLREIGHAIYEVRSLQSRNGGSVILGMPPSMIQVLAGSLAKRVATFAPRLSLRLVDGFSGHLLDWLERGDLDAAILYGPTPNGVNATKLLEDELVLVGSVNSPLAVAGTIDCQRIQELPLILSGPAHGLRLLIETAAAKAQIKLNIHTQTDSYQLLKELVESGIGYTILPYCAVTREAAAGRLSFARIAKPTITRQLYLAMASQAEAPHAVLQVEMLVREEVASLAKQNSGAFFRLNGIGDT